MKKTPLAHAVEAAAPPAPEQVDAAPPAIDEEATKMAQQAIMDYLNTLPPSARAATELYFRGILPRLQVLVAVV